MASGLEDGPGRPSLVDTRTLRILYGMRVDPPRIR